MSNVAMSNVAMPNGYWEAQKLSASPAAEYTVPQVHQVVHRHHHIRQDCREAHQVHHQVAVEDSAGLRIGSGV